jgi:hypothetical protein
MKILHGAVRKTARIISDPLTMGSYLHHMNTNVSAIRKITNKAFRRSLFSNLNYIYKCTFVLNAEGS